MARNFELERALIADPDDVAAYLVYADWLQQEGDPRGELIARMIQAESAPAAETKDDAKLRAATKRLSERLGGELADLNPSWRRGFVDAVVLARDRVRGPYPERLAALFRDRSAALLRTIVLHDVFATEGARTAALVLADAPATLCELTLGFDDDVGDLAHLHRLTRLARLEIGLRLGYTTDVPPTRGAPSTATMRSIARAPWPLESLSLRFNGGDATIDELVSALARDFPLTRLEIYDRFAGHDFAEKLVRALVASPFAPKLELLKLDIAALADADYRLLIAHRDRFAALRTVYIPNRTYQAQLVPAQ
ncbi:MAG TPA: TIGR02996 domain-containing protein [Kofleriaceae bacterium]